MRAWRNPDDLPNKDGFVFRGKHRNGAEKKCQVVQDKVTGMHYTEGIYYCDLVGWIGHYTEKSDETQKHPLP